MISTMNEEIVQGPLEHPRFGKSLFIHPTVETARVWNAAGRRVGRRPVAVAVVSSLVLVALALPQR